MIEQNEAMFDRKRRRSFSRWTCVTFILTSLFAYVKGQYNIHCDSLTRFTCNDGICISKARVCDGYWDCKTGEDEFDCDFTAKCYGRNRRMANLNHYKCGKQCILDSDCKSNKKTCKCDDECGMSCVTSDVECTNKPPTVNNSVGYEIYRRTPGKSAVSVIKSRPYFVGDVVKYQCGSGLKLVGPLPRCNVKGRWSREIPRCITNELVDRNATSLGQLHKDVDEIDAPEHAWPWQVLITIKGSTPEQTLGNMHGGGSLLNKKWVLTAAHILDRYDILSLVISVGVSKRPLHGEKISPSVQMFTAADQYAHADYSETTGLNDIALLKIGARFDCLMMLQDDTSGVTFSPVVKPVYLPCTSDIGNDHERENSMNQFIEKCVHEEKRLIQGTDVVVTDFGHTDKWDGLSDPPIINPPQHLQQATLKIEDEETCRKGIDYINKKNRLRLLYSNKLICATSNTSDSCEGDSGGPLVKKITINGSRSPRWMQIGIVRYSIGCLAGYYTSVARYINWINETIQRDNEYFDHTVINLGNLYRVVDGKDAPENAWPWQVLITKKGSTPEQTLSNKYLRGGGSLLNKKWVLTAAHVFVGSDISSLVISVGVTKRPFPGEKISSSVQMFTPAAKYAHEDYPMTTGLNDIALLKIGARFDCTMMLQDYTSGVTFSPGVKPVYLPCSNIGDDHERENSMNVVKNQFIEKCVHEEKRLIRGTNVVVTGFGHTDKWDGLSDLPILNLPQYLQQANLTIADEATCRKGIIDINNKENTRTLYSEKLICTTISTADACKGDSGGPLVSKMTIRGSKSPRWVQIGIVSYGFGCAANYPGYYTNVARYINWINETIEKDNERIQRADVNRKISKMSSDLDNTKTRLAGQYNIHCDNLTRFTCIDGICISKARVCDGYSDCETGEDEFDCDFTPKCYGRNRRMANLNNYKCGKQCILDSDCKSDKKTCKCDDECGMSCVTSGVQCTNKPPTVNNSIRYEIYRRTPGKPAVSVIKGGPYFVGDVVKYQCKKVLKLVGALPRCNVKGRWSREIPRCITNEPVDRFGGIDAPENAWPWQVLITKKGSTPEQTLGNTYLRGGGSLLNKKWVLTAAHIFLGYDISSLVISVGVSKQPLSGEKISPSVQMFTIAAKYAHAGYSMTTGLNDIALLKIGARFDFSMMLQNDSGVTFSPNVKPVYLPCTSDIGDDHEPENSMKVVKNQFIEKCVLEEKRLIRGTNVVVTGFVHTDKREGSGILTGFNQPQHLQQATLTIADETTCRKGIIDINNKTRHTRFMYSEKLICTTSSTTDACIGDGGGPLVRKMTIKGLRSPKWVQIGIVSYGLGCAANDPVYHTSVARYINWINETIGRDNAKTNHTDLKVEQEGLDDKKEQTNKILPTKTNHTDLEQEGLDDKREQTKTIIPNIEDFKTEDRNLQKTLNETQETFRQGNCEIFYENKCFLPVFNKRVGKDEAEIICAEMGGKLANIYEENHFWFIRNALKTKHMDRSFHVKLWLGMTYNATTKKVILSDGTEAKYVSWVGGSPNNKPHYNSVVLEVVQRTPDDVALNMWNVGPSKRYNPFCEI